MTAEGQSFGKTQQLSCPARNARAQGHGGDGAKTSRCTVHVEVKFFLRSRETGAPVRGAAFPHPSLSAPPMAQPNPTPYRGLGTMPLSPRSLLGIFPAENVSHL